jgi:hypothetical protein
LEAYAQRCDVLFSSLAQRRGLPDYLQGLLPRDRNKTLTGLAGAEPITGAQHREVQRLQWFLSESAWDYQQVNDRRVRLLCEDPATAPHDRGVLVVDDTGDRKDGTAIAHVARQYLGSVGKIDNGIVAVTSLWADERVYWPVQAVPSTPASRLAKGKRDPGFRTKPQLAVALVEAAQQANLAEVVRLYGLGNWVEQGDKQVKGELGWADFQVRSDRAIRRHWTLVCCAFSFCWQSFLAHHPAQPEPPDPEAAATAAVLGRLSLRRRSRSSSRGPE